MINHKWKNRLLTGLVALAMTAGLTGNAGPVFAQEVIPSFEAADSVSEDYRPEDPVSEDLIQANSVSEDIIPENQEVFAGEVSFETENSSDSFSLSGDISEQLIQEGGFPVSVQRQDEIAWDDASGEHPDYEKAGQEIEKAIREWDGSSGVTADLTDCRIPGDSVSKLLADVINDHPEFFYIDGSYTGTADLSGFVRQLTIKAQDGYTVENSAAFDQKVQEIISRVDSGWTDLQKAMYMHDYLVTHVQYDLTYRKYSAEDAIVGGSSVCEGYSLAYKYLMNKLGSQFKCEYVGSNANNHAWNYLTVDSKKYYVDCTWDDPITGDESGHSTHFPEYRCGHKNFLLSREGMAATGHNGTDWKDKSGSDIYHSVPGSSDYESAPWITTESPVPMIGNIGAYCTGLNNISLCIYDFKTAATKTLMNYDAKWPVWGSSNRWWTSNNSTLSCVGKYITASTPTTVLLVNSETGEKQTIYTLTDSEKATGYIYGAIVEDGLLKYQLYTSYNSGKKGSGTKDLSAYDSKGIRVMLDRTELTLSVNHTEKLEATVVPEDTQDKTVSFSSSDESIVTVDSSGKCTGIAPGQAFICASPNAGGQSAYCTVTVENKKIHTVTFRNNGETIYTEKVSSGETVLNPPPDPAGSGTFIGWYIDNKVLWNPQLPVTSDLILIARFQPATASGNTASGLDTVFDVKEGDTLYLVKGQKYILDRAYQWSSSDPKIAGISSKYMLQGKKAGEETEISGTLLSGEGAPINCHVYVTEPVLTKKAVLLVGETQKLNLELGKNAEHYNVVWATSNPAVASVGDGLVHALGKGSAKITAYVNGKAYNSTIQVKEYNTIKSISGNSLTLTPLQTVTLKFTDGFKLKNVKWKSSHSLVEIKNASKKVIAYQDSVVRIGTNGKLTAVGAGTTTIIASTEAGEKKLIVTVLKPAPRTFYVFAEKKKSFSVYNIKPSKMTWSSSDSSVAKIEKGVIKAGSQPGKAVLTGNYNPYDSTKGFDYTINVYTENPSFTCSEGVDFTCLNTAKTNYLLKIPKGKTCCIRCAGVAEPVLLKSNKNDIVFADESGTVYARKTDKNGKPGKAKLTTKISGRTYAIQVEVGE